MSQHRPWTAIFIDGPLTAEVKMIDPCPEWHVWMPRTITICTCNCTDDFPDECEETERGPQEFTYYPVLKPPNPADSVVLMSVKNSADAILDKLKEWVRTDLNTPLITNYCRDKRAWDNM